MTRPTAAVIMDAASEAANCDVCDALGGSLDDEAVLAREIFCVTARNVLGWSYPDLARWFKAKSHGTYHRAVQRFDARGDRFEIEQRMQALGVPMKRPKRHPKVKQLVLPYPPSANRYWRHAVVNGSARVYRSGDAKRYIASVRAIVADLFGFPVDPFSVCVAAYAPDARKRDIDNVLKIPLDAMTQAGVWSDDSRVRDVRAFWADIDRKNPRLLVTIRPQAVDV